MSWKFSNSLWIRYPAAILTSFAASVGTTALLVFLSIPHTIIWVLVGFNGVLLGTISLRRPERVIGAIGLLLVGVVFEILVLGFAHGGFAVPVEMPPTAIGGLLAVGLAFLRGDKWKNQPAPNPTSNTKPATMAFSRTKIHPHPYWMSPRLGKFWRWTGYAALLTVPVGILGDWYGFDGRWAVLVYLLALYGATAVRWFAGLLLRPWYDSLLLASFILHPAGAIAYFVQGRWFSRPMQKTNPLWPTWAVILSFPGLSALVLLIADSFVNLGRWGFTFAWMGGMGLLFPALIGFGVIRSCLLKRKKDVECPDGITTQTTPLPHPRSPSPGRTS